MVHGNCDGLKWDTSSRETKSVDPPVVRLKSDKPPYISGLFTAHLGLRLLFGVCVFGVLF